jgi:adenosylcobinamide-GDP ribazoletransferase
MDDISGDRGDALAMLSASARFLTRIPLPGGGREVPLKDAMAAFPVIGGAIGGGIGLIAAVLGGLGVPALAAAAVALAAGAMATGGLHEDGLADVADGFGGGRSPERKLEIMRDSRIGSYGVLTLVLVMLAKAAAIAALVAAGGLATVAVLAGAGAFSRGAMVWLLARTPAARPGGLGASAGRPPDKVLAMAVAIGLALAIAASWLGAGIIAALAAPALAALAALALRGLALRQIGGQTGDVCGALQMVTETVFLTVAAAMVH